MHFDAAGRPIATTDFPFEEIDAVERPAPTALDGEEAVLRLALTAALDWHGRADAFRSRMAALGVLAGVFESASDAAERMRICRRSVERAVTALRSEVRSNVALKTGKIPSNSEDFSPPQRI